MPKIIAVLDANVLFPISLRDTLLRAAEIGLFLPLWTLEIVEEMRRNLIKNNKITQAQAQRLVSILTIVLRKALVPSTYQARIPTMTNDVKDRHVLAAAVEGGANIIVTANLRDFPASALAPHQIEAVAPDVFLWRLLQQFPEAMKRIITLQAQELKKPPMTIDEVLTVLSVHAPTFCQRMREMLAKPEEAS